MSMTPERRLGVSARAAPVRGMAGMAGMAGELGDTLGLVLAGGLGTRLGALTRSSCKPALPFAGRSRLIDVVLSNCLNSGLHRVGVLTQYRSEMLVRHLDTAWPSAAGNAGDFVEAWPAARGEGAAGYSGTADALYRNLDLIRRHAPADVLVLAADHVYRMDYSGLVEMHRRNRASVTVACVEVPVAEAVGFGVVSTDEAGWIETFTEKPAVPQAMPGRPDCALASMGVYVFDADFLYECLEADACTAGSAHDFGRDVLPAIIGGRSAVLAAPLNDPQTGGPGYWRDVGTIDSYWQAHMDLLEPSPRLEVDAPDWPLRATLTRGAAPRFTGSGFAESSIVSSGCVVAGAVRLSVLASGARVGAGTIVDNSVTLEDVRIGRGCRISRAVIDAGTTVPDGTVIAGDAGSMKGTQQTPGRVAVYSGRRPAEVPHASVQAARVA